MLQHVALIWVYTVYPFAGFQTKMDYSCSIMLVFDTDSLGPVQMSKTQILSCLYDYPLWGHPRHTCHKLWTKICEIRTNFKGDLTKFCEIFLNIKASLRTSPNIVKSLYSSCKKLVKPTTVCDLCLFLHNICSKMVWKFCEIPIFYGNCLLDGPNSLRFYLTVWDMACMPRERSKSHRYGGSDCPISNF